MQLAVVAAGFTPGEADSLRRAMAAWKRKGGLGPFEERLSKGMRERGYSETFAKQIFEQIKGFGDYGFPESHSASFALLVYVSCWLKCYEPAAFTSALLNSQPMGFYGPAQLVNDARHHGVEIRPVDVRFSQWNCALERGKTGEPAVRLGLRMVKGLSEKGAHRLVRVREEQVFVDVSDLARRTKLNRGDMNLLADSGALNAISGHRHKAKWDVLGAERMAPLLQPTKFNEGIPLLPVPGEGENLVADYATLGLTLGRHPLSLLRRRFDKLGLLDAVRIGELSHGDRVRTAGLVINRQRPSTASGVIFITLEDETGYINVVLWPWVAERQRSQALHSRLLIINGCIEREGSVIHVVAGKLEDQSRLLGRLSTKSRDFH